MTKEIYDNLKNTLYTKTYSGFNHIRFYTLSDYYDFKTEDFKLEYNDWLYKICRDFLNDKKTN